jgi:hypothetical protein
VASRLLNRGPASIHRQSIRSSNRIAWGQGHQLWLQKRPLRVPAHTLNQRNVSASLVVMTT